MRKIILLLSVLALASSLLWAQSKEVQFVFTSDLHYGLTRPLFRGAKNVDAQVVNAAMVAKLNSLEETPFPSDGGRRSAQAVGPIDFLAVGGDVANRSEQSEEVEIQSASRSWAQFRADYLQNLNLRDRSGGRSAVYVVPGNHDVSNAVGYFKPMTPLVDKTSLVEIYNLMMSPAVPKTTATYAYPRDRMMVSHDIGGIHFIFITLWPDSQVRQWLEKDLAAVRGDVPVILFMHDAPDVPSKHFINPNGSHDINEVDQFENLLADTFADTVNGVGKIENVALREQEEWEAFVRKHPNITAYFHGDSNWTQFYDWTGPEHSVVLHTFRADSPIKGHFSAEDETKLSFEIATIDTESRTMTVREVLWNADPQHPDSPVRWGSSTTVALAPR
jgi:predicted MPP superfamily phosphohydrolase